MTQDLPEALAASLTSNLQHIQIIQRKEARLAETRYETYAQTLHRIATAYRTGDIDRVQLCAALEVIRSGIEMPMRMKMWNEIVGVPWNRLVQFSKQLPNGPEGSWVGEYPFTAATVAPLAGIAVVYVLFDEANTPCYVGSTQKFRTRLNSHGRDKQFTRWQAHPCRDREHAYQLEDQLLRQHKPYLNRKASR